MEEVAAEAFLSPSRFRHLFVEQTGRALRPYILWRRFLRVGALSTTGESLSTAAHRAGVADAAHLTRTSRRMFGFPPSALQMASPLQPGDIESGDATVRPSRCGDPGRHNSASAFNAPTGLVAVMTLRRRAMTIWPLAPIFATLNDFLEWSQSSDALVDHPAQGMAVLRCTAQS